MQAAGEDLHRVQYAGEIGRENHGLRRIPVRRLTAPGPPDPVGPRNDAGMADAGRVIAGSARGLRLEAPGAGTRPLGDRVKQTVFAILEPELPGSRFLDLFAGSGAAGIEALSRGAGQAIFVERDAAATRVIAANLARTHLVDRATIVTADALVWLRRSGTSGMGPFEHVLMDPPYADVELRDRVLAWLGAPGSPLVPGARVVVKHFWRDQPPAQVGLLASERERRFGETALTFYRRQEDG
jgi:16S rRNA (guanine966-N2)-methyltransferase